VRKLLVLLVAAAALAVLGSGSVATAHLPGSDGGPAKRNCGVITGVSKYGSVGVGATRVRCRVARRVARGSVRRETFPRWRCTGKGTRFGHCHGRGAYEGAKVHWYAAE
jgi:hypothetical protein